MPVDLTREQVVCAAVLAGAGLLAFLAVKQSGGTGEVPATTESMYGQPTPYAPVLLEEQHESAVMYTAHRYPHVCGQEVTTAIHQNYSMASIPKSPEDSWMIRPPSELVL